VLTHSSSVLPGYIYFTTASAKKAAAAKITDMLCRALWRSGFNSSQQAIEPQQVWAFEVPAVCVAAWLELAYIPSQHFALFNDSAFASSAREIIAVGAADGSVHLIGPNRWRRRICHNVSMQGVLSLTIDVRSTTCVAISGGMICSASIDRTVAVISIDRTVRSEITPNRIVV